MVHRLDICNSLLFEPGADFERRDNHGPGPFRDFDNIGDMVTVAVRNENEIGLDLLEVDFFGERVRADEWIEEKAATAGGDRETGVAVIGKFHTINY